MTWKKEKLMKNQTRLKKESNIKMVVILDANERCILFWTKCIPVRVALASVITISSLQNIRYFQIILSIYTLISGSGLLYNFLNALREPIIEENLKNSLDPLEIRKLDKILNNISYGRFGGKVWWHWPRPIHGTLLITCGITTLIKYKLAYVFAIIDVLFAICVGFYYYLYQNRNPNSTASSIST